MAIVSMEIDPTAAPELTPDAVIAKINAASTKITRDDAIDMDALDIVQTKPVAGEFKIKQIQRTSDGKLDVAYDDVPIA